MRQNAATHASAARRGATLRDPGVPGVDLHSHQHEDSVGSYAATYPEQPGSRAPALATHARTLAFMLSAKAIYAAALCVVCLPLAGQPAPKLADLEPVLARVALWDPSQPRDPLYEFTNYLREAMNSKAELPAFEARLLRMLAPDAKTTPAGRDFVCRQLSIIGTAASVPTLTRLLNDAGLAEIARHALARIPDPAAGAALRSALPKASGNVQAGI